MVRKYIADGHLSNIIYYEASSPRLEYGLSDRKSISTVSRQINCRSIQ
jgi:hypothetical protein